jgi:3' terminal RNA ribose 2'-O-methyltransferase Hen1
VFGLQLLVILTISSIGPNAGDLSFLFHKHPERVQEFALSFGRVLVFYPRYEATFCEVALLLDLDPLRLVGRGERVGLPLYPYVNDRPYVASSFLSVALSEVFKSALNGQCKTRPELVNAAFEFEAKMPCLPVRGNLSLSDLFGPLGYRVHTTEFPLDTAFPEWGQSPYVSCSLAATVTLKELLNHLYVLIPVLDDEKHYWIDEAEVEKLLRRGDPWLTKHPKRELIVARYLKRRRPLVTAALSQLIDDEESGNELSEDNRGLSSLHGQRLESVAAILKARGSARVLDLGCGDGKLPALLAPDSQFTQLVGVDVSLRQLAYAESRLKEANRRQPGRVEFLQGSLVYRDQRLRGFDAIALVEVIEHLDPPRLAAMERVVFEFASPKLIVVTTPNAEYNAQFATLAPGRFRHRDHRFEWRRYEFLSWAEELARRFGYKLEVMELGPADPVHGAPSQMAIFEK